MRTHNIPSYENRKDIPIIPSDLALLSILIGSNYPCLELIFMVPKVFEPLKFDCTSTVMTTTAEAAAATSLIHNNNTCRC